MVTAESFSGSNGGRVSVSLIGSVSTTVIGSTAGSSSSPSGRKGSEWVGSAAGRWAMTGGLSGRKGAGGGGLIPMSLLVSVPALNGCSMVFASLRGWVGRSAPTIRVDLNRTNLIGDLPGGRVQGQRRPEDGTGTALSALHVFSLVIGKS